MTEFKTVFQNMDWSYLLDLALSIIPALICITFHEISHGYCALFLGDKTAKNAGRLSLNPLKHIDVWGLLMMVICHFGWAKPVPVNMNCFKRPKWGMAVTAAAGPLSNIMLAVFFLMLYGLLYYPMMKLTIGIYLLKVFYITAYLSCALAVFNLIPIPPLDGSKVLFSLLSDKKYNWLMHYEKYGFLILIVLVGFKVISNPLSLITDYIFEKLFAIAIFIGNGVN